MNHHYKDIRDRIDGPPIWFDENAVPRYCEFGPDETANIYADECCLLLIECQDCGHEFKVAFSQDQMGCYRDARWALLATQSEGARNAEISEAIEQAKLAAMIERGAIHYGDPPNIGCCAAGPTMNSVPIRVLEFWRRPAGTDWERVPDLEREIRVEWWDYTLRATPDVPA